MGVGLLFLAKLCDFLLSQSVFMTSNPLCEGRVGRRSQTKSEANMKIKSQSVGYYNCLAKRGANICRSFVPVSANGTSLKGLVSATYDTLVAVFGEPTFVSEYQDDKVTCSWGLVLAEGGNGHPVVATIYDWKVYGPTPKGMYEWHIGGFCPMAVYSVKAAIAQYEANRDGFFAV